MITLAWSSLRTRVAAFVGTFVAATLSVALIGGAGLLLFSVLSAKPTTSRFDAASVMVSGDRAVTLQSVKHKKHKSKTKTKSEPITGAPTVPVGWDARIRAVDGVDSTIADYSFPVTLFGANGPMASDVPTIGHGWQSAALGPFRMRAGSAPRDGELAVDAGLAGAYRLHVGDQVRVVTRTGQRAMRVSGIVAPPVGDQLDEQATVFVADSAAPAISGLTGPTAVGARASPGVNPDQLAARIKAALGVSTVYTGAAKAHADLPAALPDYIGAISIFGFVIGITTFATIFVLTGTVGLTTRQRLRELALLRATGATPRQLSRMLRVEAALVTVVATLVGSPLGLLAAYLIASRFRSLGAVPPEFAVSHNIAAVLGGGLATMIVAQISVWLAAHRAIRIAPAQALSETAIEPPAAGFFRTVIAIACAMGAGAVLLFVPLDGPLGMGMTFISSMLLLCAVGAASPMLVRGLSGIGSRVASATGVTGWLAGAFTRAETRRVAAVAVPLALMFAINAPMLLNGDLAQDLAAKQQSRRVAAATATAIGQAPLSAITQVQGVDLAATIPTELIIDENGKPKHFASQGLYESGKAPLNLGYVSGGFDRGGLSVSSYLARARGWHVGDDVRLWLPDATPMTMRITGVYSYYRGFGDLVADASLIAQHDPRGLVSAIAVRGDVSALAKAAPTVRFTSRGPDTSSQDSDRQQGAWEMMIAISLGFTAIAVFNTFAVATSARRGLFGQLRLIGATGGQVRRVTGREAWLAVAAGLALGVVVTSVVVGAFSLAQDSTLRLLVHPLTYAGLVGSIAALGLVAAAIPARVVLRRVG